jgi:hypothetical protein
MTEAESALERFAQRYRLKIRRDEAGEPIIPGRRGHLWWDAEGLCLMIVDGRPVSTRRLKDLVGDTGKVWLGTITLDDHGRRVQDVEVRGIRPERYRAAIKIAGCRTRPRNRGASPEVMARVRAAKNLNRALDKTPSFASESRGEAREGVNHYPAQDEAILGAKEALVAVPRAELRPRTHCAAPPVMAAPPAAFTRKFPPHFAANSSTGAKA